MKYNETIICLFVSKSVLAKLTSIKIFPSQILLDKKQNQQKHKVKESTSTKWKRKIKKEDQTTWSESNKNLYHVLVSTKHSICNVLKNYVHILNMQVFCSRKEKWPKYIQEGQVIAVCFTFQQDCSNSQRGCKDLAWKPENIF